jgi:hypothetical protein
MQQDTVTSAIEKAVTTTFADMGFISARLDPQASPEEILSTNLTYSIRVLLPNVGPIFFFASEDLGRELIDNIHGMSDPESQPQLIDDTLSEMLNVMVGRIFQILSPSHPFELSLPVREKDAIQLDESAALMVFKTPDKHTFCMSHHITLVNY